MIFQLSPCLASPDARFRFLLRSVLVFFLLSALFLHCAVASVSGSLFRLQHRFGGRHGPYRWSRGKPMSSQHLQDLRSHDRLRHRRLLLSAQSYPVGGIADPNIAGLYFTEIRLGTPPSKYYVQIDTGSDLLWLNCESCKTCPQSTDLGVRLALYNPQSSSSSSILICGDTYCSVASSADCQVGQPCTYQLGYGDGSTSTGYYVRDAFQLDIVAGNKSVKTANASVAFGCGTSQGGELQQPDQALDGIMGFGQSNLSVLSQLVNQKQAPGVFAHCLEGEGRGGGILLIGQVQDSRLVYTSILPNHVDGGFPSLTLTFDGKGATMVIKPHEYLIAPEGNSGNGWCIGFQNPSQSTVGLNILGDLVLKDRIVVYDLENQRIGWADHNCSSSVAVLSPTGQVEYVQASSIASASHISGAAILNRGIVYSILWLCLLLHM